MKKCFKKYFSLSNSHCMSRLYDILHHENFESMKISCSVYDDKVMNHSTANVQTVTKLGNDRSLYGK